MTAHILVGYASKHGSTIEVAEAIATLLRDGGHEVDVRAAANVRELDAYSGIVLGGALYMGHWHKDAVRFLEQHGHALEAIPLAVFAIGPKTLAEVEVAASRKQLDRALATIPDLTPATVAVFGGVVDPTKLRFPFKRMAASDARDWDAIAGWGREVANLFAKDAEAVPS
jgi:menaquinone-dependent protoporphyrinogen oxidase